LPCREKLAGTRQALAAYGVPPLEREKSSTEDRAHRDDGLLSDWSRGMPARPKPVPPPTLAEVDGRISAALAEHDELWRNVIGALVSEVRKQLRAEIVEQVGSLRADVEIQTKAAEREHDRIIDLPMVSLRSSRRG
jgi:hypothetical protein